MIIAIRNSLFHLKSSVLLSTFNRVQIHTSIRFDRNFFNYEQFTKESNVGRKTPPKMKGKFSEIYKRRPLFWMIRGTGTILLLFISLNQMNFHSFSVNYRCTR